MAVAVANADVSSAMEAEQFLPAVCGGELARGFIERVVAFVPMPLRHRSGQALAALENTRGLWDDALSRMSRNGRD